MKIKPIPQINLDIKFSDEEIESLKTAAKVIEEIDRFIKASTHYKATFESFLNAGYYNEYEPAEMLLDFTKTNRSNLEEYLASFINDYDWGEG